MQDDKFQFIGYLPPTDGSRVKRNGNNQHRLAVTTKLKTVPLHFLHICVKLVEAKYDSYYKPHNKYKSKKGTHDSLLKLGHAQYRAKVLFDSLLFNGLCPFTQESFAMCRSDDVAEVWAPPGPVVVDDDVSRVAIERSIVSVELTRLVRRTVVARVTGR